VHVANRKPLLTFWAPKANAMGSVRANRAMARCAMAGKISAMTIQRNDDSAQ
jgi:hypothetical protein